MQSKGVKKQAVSRLARAVDDVTRGLVNDLRRTVVVAAPILEEQEPKLPKIWVVQSVCPHFVTYRSVIHRDVFE